MKASPPWRGSGWSRRPEPSSSCGRFPRPDPLLPGALLPPSEPALPDPSPRRREERERAPGARPPRRRVHVFLLQRFFSSNQKVTSFMFCACLWVTLMVLVILVKKNCTMHVLLLRCSGSFTSPWCPLGSKLCSSPDLAPIIADSSRPSCSLGPSKVAGWVS